MKKIKNILPDKNYPYQLYKGFACIGNFNSIREAKRLCSKVDGVYTLKGVNYTSKWQIVNGTLYNDDF
jgi:hypothetical protein